MSIREAMSENLSRLCGAEKSIAAVCRATGINRQQFNRYLSGNTLPNKNNMGKICRYFRIHESDLFRIPEEKPNERTPDEADAWAQVDLRSAVRMLHGEGPTSVPPGLYFVNFAHPHDPGSIMRSTLVVRRDGNLSTFRRLTGISEPKGSWWSHFNGDHKGIILERRHWLYFVALNSVGTHDPTMLVLQWIPNSDPILGGHASILTPLGPTVTAVVMSPCGNRVGLRSAIKSSHVYSVDDPDIDPIVLDALDQQCQLLISNVRRLDLSVKPLSRSKVPT